MLKRTFFLFIGVIFFSALVLLSFEGTVEAKVITLRYAEGHSQNSFEAKNTTIPWVKAVENATNGRVKIDVYWNDTLCKPMDSWEAWI